MDAGDCGGIGTGAYVGCDLKARDDEAELANPAPLQPSQSQAAAKLRILIIDDSRENRES